MKEKQTDYKSFQVKLPRETWLFLKYTALEQDKSMMAIIVQCLEKYKKKLASKLTAKDIDV